MKGNDPNGGCCEGGSMKGSSMKEPPPRRSTSGRYASYWNAFLYYDLKFSSKTGQLELSYQLELCSHIMKRSFSAVSEFRVGCCLVHSEYFFLCW